MRYHQELPARVRQADAPELARLANLYPQNKHVQSLVAEAQAALPDRPKTPLSPRSMPSTQPSPALTSLPSFRLPMLGEVGGILRAFEVSGDAMLPIASGTTIVARYVPDWSTIADGTPCLVVSQVDGILFRRLHQVPEGFSLGCDNPLHAPSQAKSQDILEIWEAKSYIGNFLTPGNMTLDHLAALVADLTQQVKSLHR